MACATFYIHGGAGSVLACSRPASRERCLRGARPQRRTL